VSGGGDVAARRATVHGRVQGVFFRHSALERARSLGVAGWVRNTERGTVELHAEGAPDAVDALVRWAHRGPAGADVQRVDVDEVEPEGLGGFEVR